MSVSDKLVQIAENMERVYEAGVNDTRNKYEEQVEIENGIIRFEPPNNQPLKLTSELYNEQSQSQLYLIHYQGRNFFDPQQITLTENFQIRKKDGVRASSGVYYISSPIPCTHLRDKYIFLNHPPMADNNTVAGFGFYSGEPSSYTPAPVDFFIEPEEGEERGDYIVKVPSNAVYMRFSIRNTHVANEDILLQVLDEEPSEDMLEQLKGMEYESFNGSSVLLNLRTPIKKASYNWDTGEVLNLETNEVEFTTPFSVQFKDGENIIAGAFNKTKLFTRTDLPDDLLQIYQAGDNRGKTDFWDWVQDSGKRTYYEFAFYRWNMEYIRPKYKAILTNRGHRMFTNNPSLKIVEKKYFDLSGVTTVNTAGSTSTYSEMFKNCPLLETIEDINMPAAGYYHTFHTCASLKTIEAFRVNKDCVFNNVFNGCTSLEEISIIDGKIGQDGLNLSWSPLNKDTLLRIVNALDAVTSQKTITLRQSAVDNAFKTAEEIETWNYAVDQAELRGWSVALMDS